jgi:S-(hydroxymethyl)glutathione dehydrogenase/alcohol dehydrogenase
MQARAAVVTGFDAPLVVEEIELRAPRENEVVVRIAAAACCITDTLSAGGLTYAPPPFVTGHAAAGIAEAVGRAVTRVAPGDRVVVVGSPECGECFYCVRGQPAACVEIFAGMIPPREIGVRADGAAIVADGGVGAYAERLIYREAHLVPVDTGLPDEQLCLLGCGVTSGLGAIFNIAQVQPGSSVAILGCGHLGLWMVQGARVAGAATIVAVEPRRERRALAGTLGATHLVDPADGDPIAQVKELTGGRGADYALEATCTAKAMEEAFLMARPGGTVVPTSMEALDSTVTLPALEFALAAKTIRGSQTGGSHILRDVPRFARMLETGVVDPTPIVTRTFTLDEINDAFAAAKAREVLTGVVMPNGKSSSAAV